MTTEAQATAANCLADQLARHEHGDFDSVVMVEAEGPFMAWLDWERAGRIAAHALIEVDPPPGWTGPTPLFTVRADGPVSSPPADTTVADAAADTVTGTASASSPSGPVAPTPPASGPEGNLVGRMLGLARQVMPIDVMRQRFLTNQMRAHGLSDPTLGSLHQLDADQLLAIIDKLEAYGEATHRMGVTTGPRT